MSNEDEKSLAVEELKAEVSECRDRLTVCEERLDLLEPQVDKIPEIDRRTLRTEKVVMDLQREQRLAAKLMDVKQDKICDKLDQLLIALQPKVVVGT